MNDIMDNNITNMIFVLILQMIIITNARTCGWDVIYENKKIIMRKKISLMTNTEKDTRKLLNKMITYQYENI
jgi:hypothetical protein